MLQQLCDRLQCYMAILSPSLSPSLSLAPPLPLSRLYCHFFFLCRDPVILLQRDDSLLYLSRPSFPNFLLLFASPRVLCPITPCPPFLTFFMSLSCSHLLPILLLASFLLQPCQSAVYFVCQIILLFLCFREQEH